MNNNIYCGWCGAVSSLENIQKQRICPYCFDRAIIKKDNNPIKNRFEILDIKEEL